MNIHEYQGKQLFAKYGIPIPKGVPCFDASEAEGIAKKLMDETGSKVVVVKAQIHAGGRGLGGGVKVVTGGAAAAGKVAGEIMGMQLKTHQTGPEGQKVQRLYIEQGMDIKRELYLGMVVDRETRKIAIMASTEGGMEIEKVAAETPEKILTEFIDPTVGISAYQARNLAFALDVGKGTPEPKKTVKKFVALLGKLANLFEKEDCALCEINPLVISGNGDVIALDSKINFDGSAAYRHKEWAELRDSAEEDPIEAEAEAAGLNYVALDGNIGCMVNGAGLAMSTMDIIQHCGGSPANFLDVGGGADKEQVTKAFKMILSSDKVKGIFVNIFGGIMKCDVIAEGVVAATKDLGLQVPLVVRLEGTNVEKGKQILKDSGLKIETADGMGDGAKKIVAATS
ncbi:MAG: ADP-forming succinate--CoA ligase subunit beta [Polyangiaceae bacterium]|nr:ADP-forming succinate--CoA ligase subunit beta [Polyangiaceae bacterium]